MNMADAGDVSQPLVRGLEKAGVPGAPETGWRVPTPFGDIDAGPRELIGFGANFAVPGGMVGESLAPARLAAAGARAGRIAGPALRTAQRGEATVDFALGGMPSLVKKVLGAAPDPRTAAQIEQQATEAIANTLQQEPGAKPPKPGKREPQLTPRDMPNRPVNFPERGGPTQAELGIPPRRLSPREQVARERGVQERRPLGEDYRAEEVYDFEGPDPDDTIPPPRDRWEATRRRSVSPATQQLLTEAEPWEMKQASDWLRAEAANEGVNPVLTPRAFERAITILREDPSQADILRRPAPPGPAPTPRDTSGLQATNDVGNRTMAPLESTQVFNDETGWFDAVVGTARENLPGRPQARGVPQPRVEPLPPSLIEQRRRTGGPEGPMMDEAVADQLTQEDYDDLLRAGRTVQQTPRQTPAGTLHEIEEAKRQLAANQFERGITRTGGNGRELEYEPIQAVLRDTERNVVGTEDVGPVKRTFGTDIQRRPPTRNPDSWQALDLESGADEPFSQPLSEQQLLDLEARIGQRRRGSVKPTGMEKDLTLERHEARKSNLLANPANDDLFATAHLERLEQRVYRPTKETVKRGGQNIEIQHPPLWQEITDPSWGVKPGSKMKGPIYSERPPVDMTKEGWQYEPAAREWLMREALKKMTGAWRGKPETNDVRKFMGQGRRFQAGKISAMQDPDVRELNYKWGKTRPNKYMDEVEEGLPVANDQGVYDWEGNQVGMNEEVEDLAVLNKNRAVDPGDPYAQAGRKRTIDVISRSGMDEGGNSLVFPDDASAREFYGTLAALKEDKAALGGAAENYLPAKEIQRLQEQIAANEEWIDMKRGEYPTQREMNVGLHDTGQHDVASRAALPEGMSRYVLDEDGNIITRMTGEPEPGGTRKTVRAARKEPTPNAVAARRAELERFGETPEVTPELEREWRRQDVRQPAAGVETSAVRPSQPVKPGRPMEADEWARLEEMQQTRDYRSREGKGLGDIDPGTRPEQRAMTPDVLPAPRYERMENGKLRRVQDPVRRFNADQPYGKDIERMLSQEFLPSVSDSAQLDKALMEAVRKQPKLYNSLPAWQQRKIDRLEEAAGAGNERKVVRAYTPEDMAKRKSLAEERAASRRRPLGEQMADEAEVDSAKFERETRTWLQKQKQAIEQSRSRTARPYPGEEKVDIEPALADADPADIEKALSKRTLPGWVIALRQEALDEVEKARGQRASNDKRLVLR